MNTNSLKYAFLGSISHGTLRSVDLLNAFISEGENQQSRNGAFLSTPEGMAIRDGLAKLIGEAQDCFDADGEEIDADKDESASELVNSFCDFFTSHFAAPYVSFGAHEGDGSDFGYWPDIDSAKEDCGFVSSKGQDYPEDGYTGEWLHVNDHGNATLYVRDENGKDSEIWSIV